LLVQAAAPALAADPQAQQADKPKKVCKESMRTGSRVPGKLCRTQAEWDKMEEDARKGLDEARATSTVNLERSN